MKHVCLTTLLLVVSVKAVAQAVTYNHDASYMQQFLVTETGAGRLTPAGYYDLFHRSYKSSALLTNKQAYRTKTYLTFYQETPLSEDIDSALIKRAEIEALNIADRTPSVSDLAWATEGGKINAKLEELRNRISQILPAGGSEETRQHYETCYNCLESATESVRESYMPLSERKRQYLEIYNDASIVTDKAAELVLYLMGQKRIESMKEQNAVRRAHLSTIATSAHGRWKVSLARGSGVDSSNSGDGISED